MIKTILVISYALILALSQSSSKVDPEKSLPPLKIVQEIFQHIDKNDDNKISTPELSAYILSEHPHLPESQILQLTSQQFEEGDKNRDNLLSLQEFVKISGDHHHDHSSQQASGEMGDDL